MQATRFSWAVRVYYEDTDAGGVVFYANYLKFMERARTEWLRSLGYVQQELIRDPGILFAVRRCEVDYRMPARLDDLLSVESVIGDVRGASLTFDQDVNRQADGQLLCRGSVRVACLDAQSLRPTRLPDDLLESLGAS